MARLICLAGPLFLSSLLATSACGPNSATDVRYRVGPSPAGDADADRDVAPSPAQSNGDASTTDTADRDDADPAPAPTVAVVSPSDGATVTNPVRFTVEGEGIVTLRLSNNGVPFATWEPALEGWSTEHTVSRDGAAQTILLEGLDAQDDVVATDIITITVAASASGPDWGVQYAENLIENAAAYLDEAWGDISGGTPCVAFFSVGLRRHPDPMRRFPDFYATVTEGPPSEACSIQGRCSLEARGFSGPHTDASKLKKGDICFTQDVAPFEGELWPDHSYVFVEWETPGRTDYAWVIDNRQEFGAPYLRNITAPTTSSSPFTPFQYFMRSPFQDAP